MESINSSSPKDDEAFFVVGRLYPFKCHITGNPEPDHIIWVVCDESGNSCIKETMYNDSVSKNIAIF